MKTAWNTTIKKKKYPKISKDLVTEIVIVGGGLVGIQSAYKLALAGKKVIVLEAAQLGSDATAHTTAFITAEIDTDLSDMISIYGKSKTIQVWNSGMEAIADIESVIKAENIDCEFMRCPAKVFANTEEECQDVRSQSERASKLGFDTIFNPGKADGFRNAGFWEIKNQAKFHPLKYLYALAEKAEVMGVQIYENTKVEKITGTKTKVIAKTKSLTVTAQYAINCTYDPLGNPGATRFKKGMYTSYVLELSLSQGKIKEGIYWDLQNPYHYFRIDDLGKKSRMIVGGADHRSELPMDQKKNYRAIQEYAKQLLGPISHEVVRKWNGPILEPTDGLPLIGEYKPRMFVAAAFSGNGMTYSNIAARMFTDIILGKKNKYQSLYDPKRTPTVKQIFKKGKDYTEELLKGAVKNAVKY